MKLIDVSVPLDATLPTYPHNTPFSLEPIKRLASGDSSNAPGGSAAASPARYNR